MADTPSAFAKSLEEESTYTDSLWEARAEDNSASLEHTTFFAFDGEVCVGLVTGDHQPLPSDPCKDEIRMRRLAEA